MSDNLDPDQARLFEKFSEKTLVSNNLDPDQTRRFVGPDLGPNCLQKLSTDDTKKRSAIDDRRL